MLPITLRLRNFLSYRDELSTLHLDGVHVACLCGANGHGKSALLDAMTWVLWGKARGSTSERLIHQGTDNMSVELDFLAQNQRYRVTRRYSRARGRGLTSLELATDTGTEYLSITGDVIRETQAHIDQLLGMDYETFVNTAFLVQGRAAQFSMAAPAQRKEVLARVLALGIYDRLEERAKGQAREAQSHLVLINQALSRLETEVGRRPQAEKLAQEAAERLAISEQALSSLAHRAASLRERCARLLESESDATRLQAHLERIEAGRHEARLEVAELERRVARWRSSVGAAPTIEAGYAELERARSLVSALQNNALRDSVLRQELAPLEQAVAAARAALAAEVQAQERYLNDELAPRAAALPQLEAALEQATAELAQFGERQSSLLALSERRQRAVVEALRLREDNGRVEVLGRAIRAKLSLLEHDHGSDTHCPLCGTEVDIDALHRIRSAYLQDIDNYATRYREQAAQAAELEREASRFQSEAATLQEALDRHRRRAEEEQALAQSRRDEAQRACHQLAQLRLALDGNRRRLAEGAFAEEESTQAEGLREKLGALSFDYGALTAAEHAMQALEPWEAQRRELSEAKERLGEDETSLRRARARLGTAEDESTAASERLTQLRKDLLELPICQEQLIRTESDQKNALRARDDLQAQRGVIVGDLARIESAERELSELRDEQRSLTEKAGIYAELIQAFSKAGVQALLIETAVPRLEEEANTLLRRMTGGRMSVKFETQRLRPGPDRTADAVETLEILIADELGTRPYELFSGGECFRVDFAIRVSLSKLLAWRAGAPLPTLFIDEGFGTQDAEGRDRIIEVIRSIEPDFERILVITHLDDIKEAFPVRIEVNRTPEAGSTFALA